MTNDESNPSPHRSRRREEADFPRNVAVQSASSRRRLLLGAARLIWPFVIRHSSFLAVLLAFTTSAVDFPLRWRWSNPLPHGGNVVDMDYSAALGLGVQVAERGQIFVTDDLDLWLPRDTFLTNALRGVAFFGQRLVIVGENGATLYSDDALHFQAGTLLDGPTTDWLESVAAAPFLLVAAGDKGAIYTSTNGVVWKRQNSGQSAWFRGAAFGNGTFAVVGDNGTIITSPNGTNWVKRNAPITQALNRVNFANGRFTAVGNAGVTLSSTNSGTNWFMEATGATNVLQYATTAGVDRLVDGVSEVRLKDGTGWSNELAKATGPPNWTYYSAIGLPGFFLIAGQTGMQSEGYQINGAPYFWLTPYDSVRNWLWSVERLPSVYVAAGDLGAVMTSGNGVDWTLELVPASVTNTTFLGVGGTTNLLLAVGDSGTVIYSPNVMTNIVVTNQTGVVTQTVSALGVIWYALSDVPTTDSLQGVGVLSNSLYVITGGRGTVLTSPDGTNWTPRVSNTTNLLSSVTEWPGGLVAVGDNGTIVLSANGISWNQRASSTSNWLYRVRWLNGTLIAVGENGTIMTSADGLAWTNRSSGTTSWLTDATFIDDTWFAVGLNGAVLTSTNLANWSGRGTLTKKPLYAAATDGGQFVVVGAEGVILRSQVVPDLTPVSFLGYSRVSTNGPGSAFNVFLFGGSPDQRFTLNRKTNLTDAEWITDAELEIFDGSGTLYYIETVSGTNIPPLEFYRTTLTP